MSEAQSANPVAVVRNQLQKMEGEFRSALPAHIPVERFTRVVMTAISNNPDLLNADRRSLFNSAMRAAQDGLLPDGQEGAIVVYRGKNGHQAQWMPMVRGILKKIRNSGELASIVARVVYDGDTFRYWVDEDGEHILFEPSDTPNTNIVRRVFAMAKTKDGELYVEPMTPEEIEKVRQASRAKDSGPWRDWWEEMAKKTAIRRLSKRLPMSTDLDDLIRRDDDLYDMQGASDAAVKAPGARSSAADRLAAIAGGKAAPDAVGQIEDNTASQKIAAMRTQIDDAETVARSAPEKAAQADTAPEATDGATEGDAATGDADSASGEASSGDAAEDGSAEEPEVTDAQAKDAYERGAAARRKGMKQSAVPPELKVAQRLFDSWNDGWAEAGAEGGAA